MKTEEYKVNQLLQEAFAQETAGDFEKTWDKVKQADVQAEPENLFAGKRKSYAKRVMGGIAAAAACIALGFSMNVHYQNMRVDTIIGLDVNPSVEFCVNGQNKVVTANALNEDAVEILEDMNLKGVDMNVAVNATIGSMVQKGYLDEIKNTVLVTVDNEDSNKAEEIKAELTADIKGILEQNNIEGKIIDVALTKTDRLKQLAQQYDISIGKAAYLLELVDEYPEFTMEELAGLTMDEITEKVVQAEIAREEAEKREEEEEMTEEDRKEAKEDALEELKEIEEEVKEEMEEQKPVIPPAVEKPSEPVVPVVPPVPETEHDDDDDRDDDKDDLDDDKDDDDDRDDHEDKDDDDDRDDHDDKNDDDDRDDHDDKDDDRDDHDDDDDDKDDDEEDDDEEEDDD